MPKKRMCDYTDQELVSIAKVHSEFKSPSFQFFVNDFLGSTRVLAMTPEAISSYFLLLLIEWNEKDCGLPIEDSKLMRFARLYPEQWKPIKNIVLEMFFESEGRFYNRRLLEVRVEQILNREKNRENVNKRWNKDTNFIPKEYDRMPSGTVVPVDEDVVEDISLKKEGVTGETILEPIDERKSQFGGPTYGAVKEFFTQNTRSSDEALNFWNEYEQKKWYVTNREGEPSRKMKTGRDWQLKAEQWIIKARTQDATREKNKPDFVKKIDNSTYKPAFPKPENNLCDCGCGRKATMQAGDHPLRLYNVAERKCFEEKIKLWSKDGSIKDALKQFDTQKEGVKT